MVESDTDKKVSTPFPAVVGQEDLKRALLALVVEDGLGGALIRGGKGTAKSTAVRALADLLPSQRAVADCPYGCPPGDPSRQCAECRAREDPPVEERETPLVTLPLGATRDRVVGTLSVEDALAGEAEFDPGLLARVNRGILYVDEVNLLEDHLVDTLLDAAASGTNRVERDGVSVSHPAVFTLVGTMNPEEGELRPQLRDRFDLSVEVAGSDEIDDRVTILDRVLSRERDPEKFVTEYAEETTALRERVSAATERDPSLPEEFKREIAELYLDAGVEGHRADIACARAARAFAALDERGKVIESDVREAAEYALAHRLRSQPFEDAPDPGEIVDDHFEDSESEAEDGDPEEGSDGGEENDEPEPDDGDSGGDEPNADAGKGSADGTEGTAAASDENFEEGETADGDGSAGTEDDAAPIVPGGARTGVGEAAAPEIDTPEVATATDETGRADAAPSRDGRGARVRTERAEGKREGIDAAATVRAAASEGRTHPTGNDLRRPVRAGSARTLTVFVADASASMAPAMRAAKGVALELLGDAYTERDEVALIAVGGDDADLLLPPTDSVSLAARHLKELPTADRTPLPAGLDRAADLLAREEPGSALVVLVSDGRANVAEGSPTEATRAAARRLSVCEGSVLVVDAGKSRAGLLDLVCEATDARRVPLSALSPEVVAERRR